MNDQSGGNKGSRTNAKQLSGDIKRILDMFFINPRLSSTPIHFCMTRDMDKVRAVDEEEAKFLEKKAIVKLQAGGLYCIALYSWLKNRMEIRDPLSTCQGFICFFTSES